MSSPALVRLASFLSRFLFTATLLAAPPAGAALINWDGNESVDGSFDGTFGVANNWNPNAVPGVGDEVEFNVDETYTVTFDSDEVADVLRGSGGDVTLASGSSALRTFTLSSGAADANISGGSIQVGTAANPLFLNLPNVTFGGGLNISAMNIGIQADGTVSVVGADSRLDVLGATNHSLGFSGNRGTLVVTGGATANVGTAGAGGTLNLADSGDDDSRGTVLVDAGGTLNTGHIDIATLTSGAIGLVTVDGSSSSINQTLAGATLDVGSASGGAGTLNVQNNGAFNTNTDATTIHATGTVNVGIVGDATFSANGPVNVAGGTLNVDSLIDFDLATGQTLTASDGGQVNFNGGYDIDGGTTYQINDGADLAVNFNLGIGSFGSGDGTLIADGAGSTVTAGGGPSSWGLSGNTANVTFRNQATGDFGAIALANDPSSDTTVGNLSVETGADVMTGAIAIATGVSGATGTITIDGGGSTLTQTGGSTLTIGSTSGAGSATIDIENGGAFNTGSGATTINATGTVNVGLVGDGTLSANGPVNVAGGTLNVGDANDFNLAARQTLTASSGGQVSFNDNYGIDNGTTFQINSGADLSVSAFFNIGFLGGDSTLIADGAGSTVTAGGFGAWARNGNAAHVTFRNQATGNFADIDLADDLLSDTTDGNLSIETDADVTTGSLDIATLGTGATGTITIDGAGSTLTQNGAATLDIGSASGIGSATIDIENEGVFNTGTGATTINATGTVNVGLIGEGTFNANGTVNVAGGALNVGLVGDLDLAIGQTLTASDGGQVGFSGIYDINNGTTFEINSGADLSVDIFFDIGESGGDGTLIVDGAGSTVTASSLNFWGRNGNSADVTFRNQATGGFGGIDLADSGDATTVGNLSIETGADVTTDNLDISTLGSAATGSITIDGAGSTLTQTGASTLTIGSNSGAGSATINIRNGGTLTTGTGATTINATGAINLSGGALNATSIDHTNGGQFNFTGGTLSVEIFQGDLINQGGTLAPGASAGSATILGDYEQQAGALEIEIGGDLAGSQHDSVSVTGGVALDGDLKLALTNDFTPDPADTFTVLDATNIFGAFENVATGQRLDTLDGGGSFVVNYGASSAFASNEIVLSDFLAAFLLGDTNNDGAVNTLDIDPFVLALSDPEQYAIAFPGVDLLAVADINSDGAVSTLDIDPFVALLTGSVAASTPEPAAGLVLLAALVTIPTVRWSFDRHAQHGCPTRVAEA